MSDAAMAAPPVVKPKPKIGGLIAIGIWVGLGTTLALLAGSALPSLPAPSSPSPPSTRSPEAAASSARLPFRRRRLLLPLLPSACGFGALGGGGT